MLPVGQRRRWHLRAAEACGRLSDLWARAYHLQAAHPNRAPGDIDDNVPVVVGVDAASGSLLEAVGLDGELALEAPSCRGAVHTSDVGRVVFVRDATRHPWSTAEWRLPNQTCLVRVSADVWAPRYAGVDYVAADLANIEVVTEQGPIDLQLRGERSTHGGHRRSAQQFSGEGVGFSMLVPAGSAIRIKTALPRGLVAMTVRAHRLHAVGASNHVEALIHPSVLLPR